MKRACLLAPLLLAALSLTPAHAQGTATPPAATPAQSTPAAATGTRTVEAVTATSAKGYSIRVPAGWIPLKNVPGADVAFINRDAGTVRPTVTVQVQDVDPKLKATLADFRDLFASQLGKDVPKFKMLGEKTVKLGSTPAILWSYLGDGEGGMVRWTQVFTVKNNRLFTATLVQPSGTTAEQIEEGRAILTSLTLK
ncbi:hypothetical protein GCM10008956_23450 [Deinococcus arenae]|uniref:Lipoprotein n=1 Tax=Deinococcus arenae TaxID=1452751 RepID=A0A8H9L6Z7_9DEIO|nr:MULTISPECIES: PsbP-related protein [Deinococcus]AWT34962.1 hypothetical protein DM785_04845 [Deinococcus actinosclerus]GGM46591.1 hypothetical protein GCM10008956_23450 [Deinococcus arenae]